MYLAHNTQTYSCVREWSDTLFIDN